MSKSKCCGWRDPKITRQGDILMIADRKSSIPRPYCMTCGRSCEIIPESAVDTAPASDATEGTGETSPPKPSKPIELERLSEILFDNFYGLGLSKQIETATQALEALVNDECIKAREDELKWANTRSPAGKLSDIDYNQRLAELRATESPRKKGGVKDD